MTRTELLLLGMLYIIFSAFAQIVLLPLSSTFADRSN